MSGLLLFEARPKHGLAGASSNSRIRRIRELEPDADGPFQTFLNGPEGDEDARRLDIDFHHGCECRQELMTLQGEHQPEAQEVKEQQTAAEGHRPAARAIFLTGCLQHWNGAQIVSPLVSL